MEVGCELSASAGALSLERLGEEDRLALKEYLHACARQGELAEADVEAFFFVLHSTFVESMCLHLVMATRQRMRN